MRGMSLARVERRGVGGINSELSAGEEIFILTLCISCAGRFIPLLDFVSFGG
jgi:hypothetical protein